MDFAPPKPRRTVEPTLPMINVVFLLLIFFLISAQIVTPPPVEIAPPTANGSGIDSPIQLHITSDGTLVFDSTRGEAVWDAIAASVDPQSAALLIRADAALPATDLAKVLARTAALGFASVQLATELP